MAFKKKNTKQPKNRKTKQFLVFDEELRADYLTGFRKRKAQRKKFGQEQLKKRMLEERKDLKKQAREVMKQRTGRQEKHQMPEVEDMVEATQFDLPHHTVTIADIAEVDFASEGGLRLGHNVAGSDSEGDTEEPGNKEDKKKDDKKLASLKRKLQRCGNIEKKKKSKSSFKGASHRTKGKKKFKKRQH